MEKMRQNGLISDASSPSGSADFTYDPVSVLLDQLGVYCRVTQDRILTRRVRLQPCSRSAQFCFLASGEPLTIEIALSPVTLHAGDILFVFHEMQNHRHFSCGSSTEQFAEIDSHSEFSGPHDSQRILTGTVNVKGSWNLLSGVFSDSMIVTRKSDHDPIIRFLVSTIAEEVASMSSGAFAVLNHHISSIGTQTLRNRIRELDHPMVGWLFALCDAEIGPIFTKMLYRPQDDWTVDTLADLAPMARSTFARKFRQLTGAPPMTVLTEIRMRAACDLLRSNQSLKEISRQAGYRSLSAFTSAFRRWSGLTPNSFRLAAERQ